MLHLYVSRSTHTQRFSVQPYLQLLDAKLRLVKELLVIRLLVSGSQLPLEQDYLFLSIVS